MPVFQPKPYVPPDGRSLTRPLSFRQEDDPRIALVQREPYRSMPFHLAWEAVTVQFKGVNALKFWAA